MGRAKGPFETGAMYHTNVSNVQAFRLATSAFDRPDLMCADRQTGITRQHTMQFVN